MRSFAIAALVGTVSAVPSVIFNAGDAPKCSVVNGETVVQYNDAAVHPSFKCTHTSATSCVCTNPHPTHHTGGCQEFDHKSGKTLQTGGDCTNSGLNAIDGGWSGWTAGACSKTCGAGSKQSTRTCTSPAPFNGGAQCSGSASKTESCNDAPCPVDGTWSGWSSWGSCSKTCGGGTQTATRTCNGRAHGGADCAGRDTKTQACNSQSCVTYEWRLERFEYGKSVGHGSHNAAHSAEEAFCVAKGGRLPTYQELCPNYNRNAATAPKLGCENSHSWMPYKGSQNNWMYVGCPGTGGHHECKDHVSHHGNPGWGSGDQYGVKLDCMVRRPVRTLTLQRFHYGKSVGHGSHNAAHMAEEAFCATVGGRLPTYQELCPNYNRNAATAPKLGCENSHSWMPYKGSQNNWMYVGCPGTGHHQCKDHVSHHGNPGWGSGDQYGVMLDCMAPKMKLQRFHYGKSSGHGSHNAAHKAEEAFCAAKGGRLPTLNELCPSYNRNTATAPKLGCENSHSWMPYKGGENNWMYVGCPGTGHHECKDHVTHHGNPGWGSGDQYGDKLDCMVPDV